MISGETKFVLGIFLAAFIGFPLLFIVIFIPISALWRYQCHNYATNTNRQVKYNYWSAKCYVDTPNGWFTYDQINQNNINH